MTFFKGKSNFFTQFVLNPLELLLKVKKLDYTCFFWDKIVNRWADYLLKDNLGFYCYCLFIRLSTFCQGVFLQKSIHVRWQKDAGSPRIGKVLVNCIIMLSLCGTWKDPSVHERLLELSPGRRRLSDRDACWKFWEEPLRGTEIPFCGHWLKFFSPLIGCNSYRVHHLLSYFSAQYPKRNQKPQLWTFWDQTP